MFDCYYYKDPQGEPVYFSIRIVDEVYEISLYQGNSLLKRKSARNRGLHILEKDDFKLKVILKLFKSIPELKIQGNIVDIQKIKRKALRKVLQDHNITNELNPKKIPLKPFKLASIKLPLILLLIGIIIRSVFRNTGAFSELPGIILFTLAYMNIFGSLVNRIPDWHLDTKNKAKFKFIVGFVGAILTMISLEFIINLFA